MAQRQDQRAPPLLRLPQEVLERVLALCDQRERVAVLPLVCTAFRQLLGAPSSTLYPSIEFVGDVSLPGPERERAACFLAWLEARGARTPSLELDFWSGGHTPDPGNQWDVDLLVSLYQTLGAVLGGCEFLRMRWGGQYLGVGVSTSSWIAHATALTCLALSAATLSLDKIVGTLPRLAHLELSTVSDNGPILRPGCLPPSLSRLCLLPAPVSLHLEDPANDGPPFGAQLPEMLLQLPKLVYLDVSESLFADEHLEAALPRLTRLTSLALDKCELECVPRALSQLTRLRVLSFDGCSVEDNPADGWSDMLCPLTRLASLSLSNCGLSELPPAVIGLPRLQHLYLEHNGLRALPPGLWTHLLLGLSTDWEPLLRSHALLAQAPHLATLALGSQTVNMHSSEGLPPLASAQQLLAALAEHPALSEVLLITRPAHLHEATPEVLECLLGLRGLRPSLAVRPLPAADFFVAEEVGAEAEEEGEDEVPAEGGGQAHSA